MTADYLSYVNVTDIIGIRTNISGFRWAFGKCDNPVPDELFEQCKIKVFLKETGDKHVFDDLDMNLYKYSFRDFKLHPLSKSLIYEKNIKRVVKLRFAISIQGDCVHVTVGKSYMKYIKIKLMYIHSISYILFDVVSMMLLNQNMTTLYCSACHLNNGNTVVCIAPPNTGKSLTALKLQNEFGSEIIAEDMAVTDGERIWGANNTKLYRNYHDDHLKQTKTMIPISVPQEIHSLFLLQKGASDFETTEGDMLAKIVLINRYSLGYYYSPCVRALDYYHEDFSIATAMEMEEKILSRFVNKSKICVVQRRNSMDFAEYIYKFSEKGIK
jgi:hypothetical protein